MSVWTLPVISLIYIGLLFACAFWGDRQEENLSRQQRMVLYSLTLAVYCSSWTFYGSVGMAVQSGWSFVPVYLGPLLMLIFGRQLWEKLVLASRSQTITSISDFIAARYGKDQNLASLVTIFAVVSILPYIALQLKAVSISVEVMAQHDLSAQGMGDIALWTALLLALLAIVFGTRRLDASEHHLGLMMAVALESVVKLIALLAVAVFVFFKMTPDFSALMSDERVAHIMKPTELPVGFLWHTLIAFFAIFCLPRQFHVSVVECDDVRHFKGARWIFGVYLVLVSIAIIPIALTTITDPRFATINPDIAILALPLAEGNTTLALLAFLGGLSAATGMVIVATLTLSTMLSNDIIVPALWRMGWLGSPERRNIKFMLLTVRRICILTISLLGYGCYRLIDDLPQLANLGLLTFCAISQFAPAIIGGLFWRGGSRRGVIAGLFVGFALWAYTLLIPMFLSAEGNPPDWVINGPLGIAWLRPQSLFNLTGWDSVTHAAFWSLIANVSFFIVVSLRSRPTLNEQIQATPFLDPYGSPAANLPAAEWGRLPIGELLALASRIVGEEPAQQSFAAFARSQNIPLEPRHSANSAWLQFTERLLAGAIGAPSARTMVTSTLRGSGMEIGQVMALLDQTSQLQRFNRELLATMMENITQGISVVDENMRLVAWNRRYLEMFQYPADMVYVGRPIADLIRYNAERGECGPGSVDEHVRKRISYMSAGSAHTFERERVDGSVIEMRGQPIPGGGFVTTFTDVTHFKRTETALAEAKQVLEQRVEQRTAELRVALTEQESAKQQAVEANISKTRFIAAASHDLLQPMNAARLFVAAMQQSDNVYEFKELVQQVDSSLRGAEELLSALLEISRLDAGALLPTITHVSLGHLFTSLHSQYSPLAEKRGLELHVVHTNVYVSSDQQWLRRILQNLVSNALRYTREGRVILGLRREGKNIRVEIWDTGPGIPPSKQQQIFEEFHRGGEASPWGEKGMGLGLAIVDRMSRLLGHTVNVRSVPGHGSVFSVTLPLTQKRPAINAEEVSTVRNNQLKGVVVLCIDNEPDILRAMNALLTRWGCQVLLASTPQEAEILLAQQPQVILADYHLGQDETGLQLLSRISQGIPSALITADQSDDLSIRVKEAGFTLLRKPLKPAALRAFLSANKG